MARDSTKTCIFVRVTCREELDPVQLLKIRGILWLSGKETKGFKSVGIASWRAFPCGSPNHPNVYTKVSYFLDWINETMKKEGLSNIIE